MFEPSDSLEPDPERAVGEVIDGEAIIINLVTGVYYSMQGIGGEIWSMICERRSARSMVEEIVARYDADAEQVQRDLDDVLAQLAAEELVRISADASSDDGAAAALRSAARQRYKKPSLEIYRDMQELLALDPPAPGMNRIAWKDGDPSGPR